MLDQKRAEKTFASIFKDYENNFKNLSFFLFIMIFQNIIWNFYLKKVINITEVR